VQHNRCSVPFRRFRYGLVLLLCFLAFAAIAPIGRSLSLVNVVVQNDKIGDGHAPRLQRPAVAGIGRRRVEPLRTAALLSIAARRLSSGA